MNSTVRMKEVLGVSKRTATPHADPRTIARILRNVAPNTFAEYTTFFNDSQGQFRQFPPGLVFFTLVRL
jgi:hypothetical protein